MNMDEVELFYLLFGFLQLIIVGLGSWTLVTVNRQGNRLTKVETLLESSLIADIADLKARVRRVEDNCRGCGS
jgi:hypothetical protein